MSYVNDISETFEELKGLPEDLRRSITSKFGKLTGMKMLTGENALQMDSTRLDARQRAYYKKMGLELPEDGEMITNILADNITIDKGNADVNVKTKPNPRIEVTTDQKDDPQPQVQPVQPPKNGRVPTWAKWAIAGLIGGNLIGGGALAYQSLKVVNPKPAGGSVFMFDVEPPPWMEPER